MNASIFFLTEIMFIYGGFSAFFAYRHIYVDAGGRNSSLRQTGESILGPEALHHIRYHRLG